MTNTPIKKTFEDIRNFNIAVGSFSRRNPNNMYTKLGYAIKKMSDSFVKNAIQEYQTAYQEAYYNDVESVQIDAALTDPVTGAVLKSPEGSIRPYLLDKEGLKKAINAERNFNNVTAIKLLEEWDKKEFDIIPYYAATLPDDLFDEEIEGFTGFCIDPKTPFKMTLSKESAGDVPQE